MTLPRPEQPAYCPSCGHEVIVERNGGEIVRTPVHEAPATGMLPPLPNSAYPPDAVPLEQAEAQEPLRAAVLRHQVEIIRAGVMEPKNAEQIVLLDLTTKVLRLLDAAEAAHHGWA